MIFHARILPIAAVALALGLAAPDAGAQYYKGKTITLLFGYSAGGTMNTQTQIMAPFLAKHIAGNPKIVVKSMPGAGGMKVQNWLFDKGPKNGFTVLHTPSAIQSQLLGQKGVRFDYSKMTVIGAMNSMPMLSYGRKDMVPGGMKTSIDIMKAAKTLKQGGLRATAWYDLHTSLSLDLLGIKYIYVPGYRGGAKIAASVRRNETQIAGAPMAGYKANYEPSMGGPNGVVMPLWYWPFKDANGKVIHEKAAGGIPMFRDVYKKVHGKAPSGIKWDALELMINLRGAVNNVFFGPPGMNPQAVKEFRAGFRRAIRDPELVPAAVKIQGSPFKPVSIERAVRTFANLGKLDKRVIGFLRDYTSAEKKKK